MSNLRLLVLFLISFLCPAIGTACFCIPPFPGQADAQILEDLRISDAVFRGKLVAHRNGAAVFKVYELWKGNTKSYAQVQWRRGDRGDCNGFWPDDLKVANELLVFAHKGSDGVFRTSICLPTSQISKSLNVLRVLGAGKTVSDLG